MSDFAETGLLTPYLELIGKALDQFHEFENDDAMSNSDEWKTVLGGSIPKRGRGIEQTLNTMTTHLIPNGSQIPKPGCTSFITTGATNIGVLTSLAGSVAAPQRLGLTAFSYLEEVSLQWLAQLFSLPETMQGVYCSGGSTANLLGLGAARQHAFEKLGIDPAETGVSKACSVYVSSAGHRTIQRACAVLGLGRACVRVIPADKSGAINLSETSPAG